MNPSDLNPSSDFDRRLTAWLDDQAPMREPDGLTHAVLARTRRTRRMPRWASPERWLSMAVITRPALAPPLRFAWLLLIVLLVVALAAGGAIVGTRLLGTTYPIPQGGAAVLAFEANGDIFTVRADGTDLRQLTSGPGTEEHPTWSPDGTLIAYRLLEGSRDSLVVMDAGGAHPVTLDERVTGDTCDHRWSTTWSPDSTGLIFPVGSSCQGGGVLFIVNTDASSPATRLFSPRVASAWATWSPDGTRLAFLGSESGGNDGLYVVDVRPADALSGGLQPHRIGPDLAYDYVEEPSRPQWSPDGSEVAVVNGRSGIFAIKADDSTRRLVTGNDAYNPMWSPDGQWLAFHRMVDPSEYWNGRPCTVRTWVAEADGTSERSLDELGDGCEAPPLWSRDGTRLASILIVQGPDDPGLTFHAGVVTPDGSSALIVLPDARPGSWQPVAAPLPPAPSFPASPSAS